MRESQGRSFRYSAIHSEAVPPDQKLPPTVDEGAPIHGWSSPWPKDPPETKSRGRRWEAQRKAGPEARDRSDGEHQSDSQEATAGEQTTGKKSVKDAPQLRSILVLSPPFTKVW